MFDRLRQLDERSALAGIQRDQTALFAPLSALVAGGAIIGALIAFAGAAVVPGIGLVVLAVWSGLFAWAGFRLRKAPRR